MQQWLSKRVRQVLVVAICESLAALPALGAAPGIVPQAGASPAELPLSAYLRKPYLDLFQLARELHFSSAQFQTEEKRLEDGQRKCVTRYKQESDNYSKQIDAAQRQLKDKSITAAKRNQLHCKIRNFRLEKSQADLLASHAIPVAYDNLRAKLDLIQQWPADYGQIREELASGSYRERRWGDVEDIGFRSIAKGQQDDIKTGQEAIRQMKQQGILPPELKNQDIVDYVTKVAQNVAAHSDLQVPLHVHVLNSKEINAFALPGGYLFVERGLLEAADDESELAGVLGHEIGHVCARHGHKLMERATVASLFYEAAEVGALILTGGVAGIGTYYALQYGFEGLGMMLDLRLLGVSREYELQADQLGIQYVWNAGYDPTGFIRFFDKMATKEGYVSSASWFRDHPPFLERMIDAEREIDFLPKKTDLVVQTSAFLQMKKELAPIAAKAEKQAKNRPSLMPKVPGCSVPENYTSIQKAGGNIDSLCQN